MSKHDRHDRARKKMKAAKEHMEKRSARTDFHMQHDTRLLRHTVMDWFGADNYQIEDAVAVLWCGWEADSEVLLVRLPDGSRRLVIENPSSMMGPGEDLVDMLRKRGAVYRQTEENTAAFISLAEAAIGNAPSLPPEPGDEMPEETDQ